MLRYAAAVAACVAVTALLPSDISAQASGEAAKPSFSATDYGVSAWSEAVVSVADLDESTSWLVEDGNWRVVARGDIDRVELKYWKLPPSVSGAFLKVCAAEAESGCIRFMRFDGADNQRPIRLAARPWDTGGIFSIMLRSDDTQALFDAAIARGWWAESEPYHFSFGGSDLVNVVVRGPHGVNYALYEREAPPFTAFPVGPLSQGFNTMRMVKDQPVSLAWYRDLLGLKVLFDAPFTDPEPRSNNFSVPANLATELVRRAAVVQPELPGEDGRMELMEFEGFEGRDYSRFTSPPNLGIISVRYPVAEFEAYRTALKARHLAPEYSASNVPVGGLGVVELMALRDPDGNLTEFYNAP
ncbi:MAG: VOC family protein [Pseudomonadota bacterium]